MNDIIKLCNIPEDVQTLIVFVSGEKLVNEVKNIDKSICPDFLFIDDNVQEVWNNLLSDKIIIYTSEHNIYAHYILLHTYDTYADKTFWLFDSEETLVKNTTMLQQLDAVISESFYSFIGLFNDEYWISKTLSGQANWSLQGRCKAIDTKKYLINGTTPDKNYINDYTEIKTSTSTIYITDSYTYIFKNNRIIKEYYAMEYNLKKLNKQESKLCDKIEQNSKNIKILKNAAVLLTEPIDKKIAETQEENKKLINKLLNEPKPIITASKPIYKRPEKNNVVIAINLLQSLGFLGTIYYSKDYDDRGYIEINYMPDITKIPKFPNTVPLIYDNMLRGLKLNHLSQTNINTIQFLRIADLLEIDSIMLHNCKIDKLSKTPLISAFPKLKNIHTDYIDESGDFLNTLKEFKELESITIAPLVTTIIKDFTWFESLNCPDLRLNKNVIFKSLKGLNYKYKHITKENIEKVMYGLTNILTYNILPIDAIFDDVILNWLSGIKGIEFTRTGYNYAAYLLISLLINYQDGIKNRLGNEYNPTLTNDEIAKSQVLENIYDVYIANSKK